MRPDTASPSLLFRLTLFGALLAVAAPPPDANAASAAVGLSSVRSRLFASEDLGVYQPERDEFFAHALASGDFNGDGADDLATGIPRDNGPVGSPDPCLSPTCTGMGAVVVRYGKKGTGLDTGLATTFLNQLAPGNPDPAEEDDNFGDSLAACDFNGDGFSDLAIGIPSENLGVLFSNNFTSDAGAVEIHYGASGGIHAAGDQFLTQDTPGIPGDAEFNEYFGTALACGDFNGDGFADLAIGTPREAFEGSPTRFEVGTVAVVPGSATGLDPSKATGFDQDTAGMVDDGEDVDEFGSALAAADFDGDGFDDLAIGVPGEDNDGSIEPGKGAVQILFGASGGLSVAGNLLFHESDLGGVSEVGDAFGSALAAGDFDGDGFADLAIGGPGEDSTGGASGTISNCGQVMALYGSSLGFDVARSQVWSQRNILGAVAEEADDRFGSALAAGDFDHDGHDDLAIGQPGEQITGIGDGAITVIDGSGAGLTAARRRGISEGSVGFPGSATLHGNSYGYVLTSGDFDGDGHADLAIGAPEQDVFDEDGIRTQNVGAEVVLYGVLFGDGFETGATDLWSFKTP